MRAVILAGGLGTRTLADALEAAAAAGVLS
jgi:dTDP-glucose pyrophosphorylase